MWLSPCCKAKTEKVSAWISHAPRSHKCTKCSKVYTADELTWEPPLK